MHDTMRIQDRIRPVIITARAPRVGLAGRITLRKYGRGGVRLPVRVDRSKRAFQRVWEHHQANLITDAGLDHIGENTIATLVDNVAVGTGSDTPAVSDTALSNEIARSSSQLGLGSDDMSAPSTGVHVWSRFVAFDFNEANGNLTEFGGFASSSGGQANTRELFRDGVGDPVPVTKTSDEQLGLTYGIETQFGPTSFTSAGSINVTGMGSFDLEFSFGDPSGSSDNSHLGSSFPGSSAGLAPEDDAGTRMAGSGIGESNSPGSGQEMLAYTPGSHQRQWRFTQGAVTEGYEYGGMRLFRHATLTTGRATWCTWNFTDPVSRTREADYRLIGNAVLSWDRA